MPSIQGKIPRVYIDGKMQGKDANGNPSNDSIVYRGRPYSKINAIDQEAIDSQREDARPSQQKGLRTIGYYLTTSSIIPGN